MIYKIARMDPRTSTSQPPHRGVRAFSLVELLVVITILGAFMVVANYIVSHLIFSTKVGIKQKAIDDWGRLDYLLETDIREAQQAVTGSLPTGTSCTGSSSSPALALLTPYTSTTAIVYYNSTDGGKDVIRRCGPAVLVDGTLSPTISSDNIVVRGATLTITTADNKFVEYEVSLDGLPGLQSGFARLRSRSY